MFVNILNDWHSKSTHSAYLFCNIISVNIYVSSNIWYIIRLIPITTMHILISADFTVPLWPWSVALSDFAHICWYINTGAFLFLKALYSVHLMFLSWNRHSSGWLHYITRLQRPMQKIHSWGACECINQDNNCFVCLVMFVLRLSYMKTSLGLQKMLLAVIQ